MTNKAFDPSLLRLTLTLLRHCQGLIGAAAVMSERERSAAEYQMLALLRAALRLHDVSAQLSQTLDRLASSAEPLVRRESDTAEAERAADVAEAAEQVRGRLGRLDGSPVRRLDMQLARCLGALRRYYAADDQPAGEQESERESGQGSERESGQESERESGREREPLPPGQETAANAANPARVLLIPNEIIKVKIGNRSFSQVIP